MKELSEEWLKHQKLLVISPHPDDAIIGCGGLMAKLKSRGSSIYVMTIVVGDEPQYGGFSKTKEREIEESNAMGFLKVDKFEIAMRGGKFHLRLDTMPQKEIIDLIEKKSSVSLEKIKPTIVAIPSICSENQDHVAVAKASFTALRPRSKKFKHSPDLVISYEQGSTFWSMDTFKPNLFVDIADYLSIKLKALSYYKSQIPEKGPNPRTLKAIEALATLRGTQICTGAAEAYECIRMEF